MAATQSFMLVVHLLKNAMEGEMKYILQILVIVAVVILMFFGLYSGIMLARDASRIQYELAHSMSGEIGYGDQFSFDIQRPTTVQASGKYTTEIYVKNVLEEWAGSTLTTTEVVTFSIEADPKYIRIEEPRQITLTLSPDSITTLSDPVTFIYSVRGDVDLPEQITVEYYLDTRTQPGLRDQHSMLVHTESSFVNKELPRVILSSIAAVLWLVVIVLVAVWLFSIGKIAGIIFVLVLLVVGILLFPPVKQAIETVATLLKAL